VRDKKRILPCSAWLQGEFGMKDLFLGVPCKLGAAASRRSSRSSSRTRKAALGKSADAVRETMALLS
jgi:malate dehydrogenase